MSDWDTTYSSGMSPFSFDAKTDKLAGLSPFGKQLGQGMAKGVQDIGKGMMAQQAGANPFQMGAMGLADGMPTEAQRRGAAGSNGMPTEAERSGVSGGQNGMPTESQRLLQLLMRLSK